MKMKRTIALISTLVIIGLILVMILWEEARTMVLGAIFNITVQPLNEREKVELTKLRSSEILNTKEAIKEEVQRSKPSITGDVNIPLINWGGITLVEVRINESQPYLFELDTGANYTTVSPDVAIKEGVLVISDEMKGGYWGRSFYLGKVRQLKIGDARVVNEVVGIINAKVSVKLLGLIPIFSYKGSLGLNSLKHFLITIDYPNNRLILQPKDSKVPNMGVTLVPFELKENLILIDTYVNGQGPFKFLFDTGATGATILVEQDIARQLGFLKGGPRTKPAKLSSLGVHKDAFVFPIAKLEFGGFVFENLTGIAATEGERAPYDGVIGKALLEEFKVTIDFDKQVLYIEKLKRR
jgi:predicted aspartyl protease